MKKKKLKNGALHSKRLTLSPMTDEQLRALVDGEPDEHLREAYGQMLEGCLREPDKRNWHAPWEMRLSDGTLVGRYSFMGPPENGEVEIGCGVLEPFRGQGYAAEALELAVAAAMEEENLYFVTAETEVDNAACLRLLEKLKFQPDGQGAEGPRFVRERDKTSWMSIYMCLGLSCGLCFGVAQDKQTIGMCVGMALGVAVGLSLDQMDKNRREAFRKKREAARGAVPAEEDAGE